MRRLRRRRRRRLRRSRPRPIRLRRPRTRTRTRTLTRLLACAADLPGGGRARCCGRRGHPRAQHDEHPPPSPPPPSPPPPSPPPPSPPPSFTPLVPLPDAACAEPTLLPLYPSVDASSSGAAPALVSHIDDAPDKSVFTFPAFRPSVQGDIEVSVAALTLTKASYRASVRRRRSNYVLCCAPPRCTRPLG